MQILNIAGYRFVELENLTALRELFLAKCDSLDIKGTILLSNEGININLAAKPESLEAFKAFLQTDSRFSDMRFHETYSEEQPYRYMKIKLKEEIITLRQPNANPAVTGRAPHISPEEFKQWLDENRDITVLDTRNDYEVRFGTFKNAVNLHIDNFGEFPEATKELERQKPIVMFCTGGIRCEKAALYMLNEGFENVYQLEGGILNYFAKVGGEHYDGECFVFDERISVDPQLKHTHTVQCRVCQGPVTKAQQQLPAFVAEQACSDCHTA